jgi:hypothetical protein
VFVFLDIDGVLNRPASWVRVRDDANVVWSQNKPLDGRFMPLLNRLLRELGPHARLVIASDWRLTHTLTDLRHLFTEAGLEDADTRVLDVTPDLSLGRAHEREAYRLDEIRAWCARELVDEDEIVILDDGWMDSLRLVQVRTGQGLTQHHVTLALRKLGVAV